MSKPLLKLSKLSKTFISQPLITCSKLTTQTMEQGVNMFKVNNKDTRTMSPVSESLFSYSLHSGTDDVVLVFLLVTLKYFTPFFTVFLLLTLNK